MYHPRHLNARHRWLISAAVALVLVGVVVSVELVRAHHQGSSQSTTVDHRADTTPRRTPAGAGTTAPSAHSLLVACRSVHDSQAKALSAAARSLAQWRIHVGAMNKLVAGDITLAQATRFWNATRAGAAHRVRQFRSADNRVSRSARCHAPNSSSTPSARLSSCLSAVEAAAATLATARRAIRTWAHHIADMEMLRMGQLSPTQAINMWIMNWHKGVRQLARYHAAARLSDPMRGCFAS